MGECERAKVCEVVKILGNASETVMLKREDGEVGEEGLVRDVVKR